MNTRPVTGHELYGFASVLNRKKRGIRSSEPCLDTCGTGGDRSGTFNISSMAALVASSCGAPVAKHGNRSVSSRSGSADFYERLGIPVDLAPDCAEELLEKAGFTFLFAPLYHRSMRHVAKVRRELGIRTVMNLLGPLANPADAPCQLIGVYDAALCTPMAEAASLLGKNRVMVVHSDDGLDEISVCAPTMITEIEKNRKVREYLFHPEEAGLELFSPGDLAGGTPEDNAEEAMALLGGGGRAALREAVCLNAGAALYLHGKAASIAEGHLLASEALLSGKTSRKLDDIRAAAAAISRRVEEVQLS
jgi:anthranilate synthase/phosphoribosyltransferase